MKFEFDLDAAVEKSLKAALNPERVAEVVEKQVTKTVDEAINEAFRSYGDFGKAVKEALSQIVPHEISIDGQAQFRDSIIKIVSARLSAYRDENLIKQLDETMGKLLEKQPVSVTLSSLIEIMVKDWSSEYERDGSDKPTIIVEESTGITAGMYHIYLDPKSDKHKYSCRVRFGINQDTIFTLMADEIDISKSLFVGSLYNFDRHLFWLYTGGTKIIVDKKHFDDVYYSEESED